MIFDGEVAILDDAGNEIVRHGASGFTGELNLMSGQTVFVTALVTKPLRYIAVERDALRSLLFEDGALSDLLLSTFIARRELLQASDVGFCHLHVNFLREQQGYINVNAFADGLLERRDSLGGAGNLDHDILASDRLPQPSRLLDRGFGLAGKVG